MKGSKLSIVQWSPMPQIELDKLLGVNGQIIAIYLTSLSHSLSAQPTFANDRAEQLDGVSFVVCQYELRELGEG